MKLRNILHALAVPLLAAHALEQRDSLSQEYCSSENTASDYAAVSNIYQSNGACQQQCVGSYAFAIVQYQQCWCSNYIPADQVSVSSCNTPCPGYPDEYCGNKDSGLYGYIPLTIAASGTAGSAPSTEAPSSTSTSTTPSSTTYSSTSQEPASTSTAAQISTTPTSTSTTSTSTTSTTLSSTTTSTTATPTTSSTAPATTSTPSPVVSTQVVTISGAMITQTVTSTPAVFPASESAQALPQRKGLSGGAIAGIVIAILLALLALLAGAFLLYRRRRQTATDIAAASSLSSRGSPHRNVSVLSRVGLLARGAGNHHDMSEHTGYPYDDANPATGQNSVRHSMLFNSASGVSDGVAPVSPLAGGGHESDESSRRYSRPLVYDQRLNPSALFANADAMGSRVSIADNQDYSRSLGRTLGVMNPDTRSSFASSRGPV